MRGFIKGSESIVNLGRGRGLSIGTAGKREYLFEDFGIDFVGIGPLSLYRQSATKFPTYADGPEVLGEGPSAAGCNIGLGHLAYFPPVTDTYAMSMGIPPALEDYLIIPIAPETVYSHSFFGGVFSEDHKIAFVPRTSANICVVDTTNPVVVTTASAHGQSGTNVFAGGAPTVITLGEVDYFTAVFAPDESANVGLYSVSMDIFTEGPARRAEASTPVFCGAVTAEDGAVVFVPYNCGYVSEFDPATSGYSDIVVHGKGLAAFAGGCNLPDGKIVFAPYNSDNIGIYDHSTGQYSDGPAHGEGDAAFKGCCILPDGRVLMAPFNSEYVGIYDHVRNKYVRGPAHGAGAGAFTGCTLLENGEVALAPYNHTNVGIVDFGFGNIIDVSQIIHPMLNKF